MMNIIIAKIIIIVISIIVMFTIAIIKTTTIITAAPDPILALNRRELHSAEKLFVNFAHYNWFCVFLLLYLDI